MLALRAGDGSESFVQTEADVRIFLQVLDNVFAQEQVDVFCLADAMLVATKFDGKQMFIFFR